MNSFFPDVIVSWNLFMEMFKYNDVPSIGVLKNDITALIRLGSKTLFKIHDPVGLRYLFVLYCIVFNCFNSVNLQKSGP